MRSLHSPQPKLFSGEARTWRRLLSILPLLGVLLPLSLAADPHLQTDITVNAGSQNPYGSDKTSSTDPTLSDQYTSSGPGTFESSQVYAAYGAVTVTANASSAQPAGISSAVGSINFGYWQNRVSITSPGRDGTPATIRQTFHTSGGVSARGSSSGGGGSLEWIVNAGRPDGLGGYYSGQYSSAAGPSGDQFSDFATFTVDNGFVFGVPFELFGSVRLQSNAGTATTDNAENGSSAGTLTLRGGGFAVLDDQGQPISYTAEDNVGSSRGDVIPTGGSYGTITLTNSTPGRFGSTASLLGGTASAATNVTTAFVAPPQDNTIKPVSDVVDLTGTNSDPVVVKVSFDPTAAQSFFGSNYFNYLALSWVQTSTGTWKNAVLGNTGATEPTFFNRGYNPATDFHLGYFGVDAANKYAWAVVNHNSQFAVTFPPPPLAVTSVTRPSPGVVHLNCKGEPARANRVEVSTNLQAWTTLATVTAGANGVFQYDDSAASGTKRFYRVAYP